MIKYPDLFLTTLSRAPRLKAAVDGAIVDFSAWFDDSKVPFFPDYTDHGIDHLTKLLATAEALIAPRARAVITASDVAVLILSSLLHDSAMHLARRASIPKSLEMLPPALYLNLTPPLGEFCGTLLSFAPNAGIVKL